jgi:hypothetical protein
VKKGKRMVQVASTSLKVFSIGFIIEDAGDSEEEAESPAPEDNGKPPRNPFDPKDGDGDDENNEPIPEASSDVTPAPSPMPTDSDDENEQEQEAEASSEDPYPLYPRTTPEPEPQGPSRAHGGPVRGGGKPFNPLEPVVNGVVVADPVFLASGGAPAAADGDKTAKPPRKFLA